MYLEYLYITVSKVLNPYTTDKAIIKSIKRT